MADPKVAFNKKEYEAVRILVESGDFKDLAGLLKKMDKASIVKPKYGFLDAAAREIANEVLGDDVYFATATPGTIVRHNRYFNAHNVDAEAFTKACKVAKATWKKPIFFDVLAMSAYRLAAQPLYEKEKQPPSVFGSSE